MPITSQKIVDKSTLSKLEKVIEQYKFLEEKITEYKHLKEVLFNYIIDIYEEYDITKHKGIRLLNESVSPKLTIKELKSTFNNPDTAIVDSLVVDLDIEKSIESLMYIDNLPDPIVYGIRNMLKNIEGHKNKRLVIERE